MKEVIKGIATILSSIIFQVVLFAASILPLFILDWSIWKSIIALAIIEIPFVGSFVNAGIWLYAFIRVLNEPFDILSIIFFVLFGVIAIYYIIMVIGGIISAMAD